MNGRPALRKMGVINAVAVDRPTGSRLNVVPCNAKMFEASEKNLPDVTIFGRQRTVPCKPLGAIPGKRKFNGPTFIYVGITVYCTVRVSRALHFGELPTKECPA